MWIAYNLQELRAVSRCNLAACEPSVTRVEAMTIEKGSPPLDVNTVANYFIRRAHDAGEPISPLKLQKLVYYAQAWYLAIHGKPLMDEEFQAWVHGPVNPRLYSRFRGYGWQPIQEDVAVPKLRKEVVEFLDEVWDVYGGFTAVALERMTHNERPWKAARAGLPPDAASNAEISQESMREYYAARLNG